MAQLSARRAACAALRTWRKEGQRADWVIHRLLAEKTLSAPDRAFALELFYGVLRNLTLLDFWISHLRLSRPDVDLRDILRLGLYQIFFLEIPEHASVYESVALAPRRNRGVINGILRTALRQRDELRSQANVQPLSVRSSHPEFLIQRWEENFGSEAASELCAWNNQPPPVYGRINRLKISYEEFARTYSGFRFLPDLPGFVEFSSFPTEALKWGHSYIQDPSTALACHLLDPQPDEKILDACGAPGGKTSYLAEMMQNRGLIVTCDRESKRVALLKENILRLGVENARVLHHDWTLSRVPEEIPSIPPFDRILIDAPCTNTGVMRRRVDVRWRLQPDDFIRMQKQQIEIIRAVTRLLKPGGVLVYSTCSLEPEENEHVARQALIEFPQLRLAAQKYWRPFENHFDGAFATKLVSASPTSH